MCVAPQTEEGGEEEEEEEAKGMVNSGSIASLQQSDTDSMVHSPSASSLHALTSTAVIASVLAAPTPAPAPTPTPSDAQAQGDGINANANGLMQSRHEAELKPSEMEGKPSAAIVEKVTSVDGATTTIITIGQEDNNLNIKSKLPGQDLFGSKSVWKGGSPKVKTKSTFSE